MKLFLIRHGQSQANVQGVYAGQSDVSLTEKGREQAKRLAPVLSGIAFEKVYSSDLIRAADTARLALCGREPEQTALLREYDLGSLVGKPLGMPRDSLPGDYTPFGGENAEQVIERLQEFLTILEKEECENVAAFIHGGVMGCMFRIILGERYMPSDYRTGNCAVNIFEFENGKWRIFALNWMGTLSEDSNQPQQ